MSCKYELLFVCGKHGKEGYGGSRGGKLIIR